MGFLEAIEKRIDEKRAEWDAWGPSDFDAWDSSELEERVAGEEACYTFDWYDDHHYEKIYSGHLMACRALLELYEKNR